MQDPFPNQVVSAKTDYGRITDLLFLFVNRCTDRTYACTSTAAEASISIDYVLAILFLDGTNGACFFASAAAQTFVFFDFESHFALPPYCVCYIITQSNSKINRF